MCDCESVFDCVCVVCVLMSMSEWCESMWVNVLMIGNGSLCATVYE